jgi:hypothetical protein
MVALSKPTDPNVILYIGYFNFDCSPDTIIATANDPQGLSTPLHIAWGEVDEGGPPGPCSPDSLDHVPSFVTTPFQFPTWNTVSVAVAVQRLSSDTLDDIILFMWGTVGDSSTLRDTSRVVVIFGQNGLDTVPIINVATMTSPQLEPIIALELREGYEFTNAEYRDPSLYKSYILQPVNPPAPPPEEKPDHTTEVPSASDIRVYPNPTPYATQVEIKQLPPGDYHVEVIAVNGKVQLQQSLTLTESGDILRTLNLGELPSGYYILRVYSARNVVGSYPIIKTR